MRKLLVTVKAAYAAGARGLAMLEHRFMQVDVPTGPVEADLEVIGLPDGEEVPPALADVAGASDVKTAFKKTTLLRPAATERILVVGLGKRDELTAERLRVAAAVAAKQAQALEASSMAWALPESSSAVELPVAAGAVVEGTILASYRFDRFQTDAEEPSPTGPERLVLLAPDGADTEALSAEARFARAAAEGANRARELQDLPANVVTPTYLAERARQISAAFEPVSVEVIDRAGMKEAGMGGLVAVSQGTAEEPALITLRYSGGPDGAAPVGLVGKAVTFDSGGISIKPSAKMEEMKMDMSGGAAVLEAMATIAELGLPVNVVAAIPSTENMPSGTATRPGDIITQLNGKTVEVNNTDAEGRLILADALTYCVREMGAERVVDLATLTGAVLIALGSTHAALISNDDGWAAQVGEAGDRTGEITWRLPLHDEYKELTKGRFADLTNSSSKRKAGTIYAGSFLEEFVDGKPWVHLDIAGTAWDVGREYVGNGATGYGVRLLTALARELSA
jgi:leucyl aminopeptidase